MGQERFSGLAQFSVELNLEEIVNITKKFVLHAMHKI